MKYISYLFFILKIIMNLLPRFQNIHYIRIVNYLLRNLLNMSPPELSNAKVDITFARTPKYSKGLYSF